MGEDELETRIIKLSDYKEMNSVYVQQRQKYCGA